MEKIVHCKECNTDKTPNDFEYRKNGEMRLQCKECRIKHKRKTRPIVHKLVKPDIDSITCRVCNITKGADQFPYIKRYGTYAKKCKACHNLVDRIKNIAAKNNPPPKPDIKNKVCRVCNVEKNVSDFPYYPTKGIYTNKCKSCRNIAIRERKENNKATMAEPQDINAMMNKTLSIARKTNESIENYYNKHMKQYE